MGGWMRRGLPAPWTLVDEEQGSQSTSSLSLVLSGELPTFGHQAPRARCFPSSCAALLGLSRAFQNRLNCRASLGGSGERAH